MGVVTRPSFLESDGINMYSWINLMQAPLVRMDRARCVFVFVFLVTWLKASQNQFSGDFSKQMLEKQVNRWLMLSLPYP